MPKHGIRAQSKRVHAVVLAVSFERCTHRNYLLVFYTALVCKLVVSDAGVRVTDTHDSVKDELPVFAAASILLLIDAAARQGKLLAGDHLLCLAAGAGLVWGGLLLRW